MNSEARAARLLLILIAAHFLVDAVASVINPLWPMLQRQTTSSDYAFFYLLVCWNLSTSVSQIGFGLWGDRSHSRWLIWAGPSIAVLSLSAIGFTTSLSVMCVLVSAAGLGIAAFHPEAASLAGNCAPAQRSRAISLFQLGGFLGQTAGPYAGGQIAGRWGTVGLLPGLIWTLGLMAIMGVALRTRAPIPTVSRETPERISDVFRGNWGRLAMLLLVGVLRIIPAAGVPMALAFLESAREIATADIGLIQSAFTFGIGGGGLIVGLLVPRRWERLLLWLLPVLAAPIVWTMPDSKGIQILMACATAGLLLGGTMPVLISLGQKLLPKSQRVGTSITMGLSWGLGGGVAGLLVMNLKPSGEIERAFPLFALSAILSSLLCGWLPQADVDSASTQPEIEFRDDPAENE